ncbi:hypothetical protein [Acidithiobacillus sp.]
MTQPRLFHRWSAAADLHLLRLLDGVTVPLDLLYYFQRVATACGVSLEDGMAHHL